MATMSRRCMVAAALAAPLAAGFAPGVGPGLSRGATRSGRRFGAAVQSCQLRAEPRLAEAVARDCGSLTPELHLKWNAVEPSPGELTPGPADELVAFARRHGMQVRGHALIWDRGTPDWARRRLGDADGWALVVGHFERTLGRFADWVRWWDVVNEPTGDYRSDGVRDDIFRRAFGPDYVARALRTAAAAAPRARLALNDYGFDYENETEARRRVAFLALLRRLRAENVPLHGVGVQAHLDLSKGSLRAETVHRFLQEIAALDLEIAVTELDVKESDFSLPVEERDRRVAAETAAYLQAALAVPAVTSVTTWGLSDRHSWLPPAPGDGGPNRGLPYDAAFAPKPMYYALRDALSRA